jgi:hypothetical protein
MDERRYEDYNFDDMNFNSQPAQPLPEKKGFPSWAIVLIVVGVVGVFVVGAIFMGVVFLWAESFEDSGGGEVVTLNLRGTIEGGDDVLIIEVYSGTVEWSDYSIMIDDTTPLSTTTTSTSAGMSAEFSSPLWDPEVGTTYDVKIIEISDNKVVWQDDIVAMV